MLPAALPRLGALLAAALLAGSAAPAQLPLATTGDLLVSSHGNHRLLRLAPDGRELARFNAPSNSGPRGVAVRPSTGEVYVALQNLDEVLVLDAALQVLRRFPTAPVQSPTGMAFAPDGTLHVAGFRSQSVGVFAPDGSPLRSWRPAASGNFLPNCIAFEADGRSYVADVASSSLIRFDAAGNELGRSSGFGLRSPMGVAIRGDEVFVSGGSSHNVVVFDRSGTALREIRHPDMSGPQGIAFDRRGVLVVTNYFNHRVNAFRPDGSWLWTSAPPSARTPRGFAFLEGAAVTAPANPVAGTPTRFAIRSRHEPRRPYVAALAFRTSPGIPLPDGRTWDLAPDALFLGSLFGTPPVYQGFFGLLDPQGRGVATLHVPALPVLQGVPMHVGALTLRPGAVTEVGQIAASVRFSY